MINPGGRITLLGLGYVGLPVAVAATMPGLFGSAEVVTLLENPPQSIPRTP